MLKCITNEIENIGKFKPDTYNKILEEAQKDIGFMEIIKRYYNERCEGLDTMDRDLLYDIIARAMGCAHWPLHMDSQEYSDAFFKTLKEHLL